MTTARRPELTLADLPIPRTAKVTRKWPAQMVEMADHIGAFHTLHLIAAFGGQQMRIPLDPDRSPFRDVLDPQRVDLMARIYGGNELELPVGRAALDEARRAPVLASVRAGDMTVREAARILGTARTYVSQLVNRTAEAEGAAPLPSRRVDKRQLDMFPDRA
ncbi:hypothetical protein QQS45_00170 [Alteriqipengyuania flavescens]|uniref:helix-turn-helix domain-containing protein n=1 Tax=Alteriqipengyuania flavescens TaxID=3053610 RepID=UPI0025B30F90|nr:helix-turn-helix domain-containing protein [Alteriqipengyuania flavescens]WJY18705.1 hypothetical protein QQW98_00170 [Alteriqipengyuania flavescens]WJY24645.1 hypothetical protein QQS45_00170 [Alteriqipengyuania flavescens]